MEKKTKYILEGVVSSLLLIIGFLGVLSISITLQNLNILLLALLPVGLFFQNHLKTLQAAWGKFGWLASPLRYFYFGVFILGFIVYIIGNWGTWTPVFMVIISLGFFFANHIFIQKENTP